MRITRETVLEKMFERVGEAFNYYTEDDFRDYVAGAYDMASALLEEMRREDEE